jgi:hypothetical protein
MQKKCISCGAIQDVIEQQNCKYCGSAIELSPKNKKAVKQNSDLSLALIEFRDNDFEKCISTLNKIISKDPENQTVLVYKHMCDFRLYDCDTNFFNKLNKSEITTINDEVYDDLYITFKRNILPNEQHSYNPLLEITYDKLFKFLTYQNAIFKNKILNLIIEVYSWEQQQTSRKLEKEDSNHWGLGYRPYMLEDIKRLIFFFEKENINKENIKKIISTIQNLYIETIKYYWKETEQAFNNFNLNKEPSEFYKVEYKINLYQEIHDVSNLIELINQYQIKYPDIDLKCDKFKTEILNVKDKFKSIDATSYEDKKKCFVATAVMGDYNHPVVLDLRQFRDNWLLKHELGIRFTNWYYTYGPFAASTIEKSKILKTLTFLLIIKPIQTAIILLNLNKSKNRPF